MAKTFPTKYPGVRYKESSSRRHNGKPDRCYSIRYAYPDKKTGTERRREELVGWASEGVTPSEASTLRGELIRNIRYGNPPYSLKEKREMAEKLRQEAKADRMRAEIEARTFDELAGRFLSWARENKKSWADDETRYRVHIKPVIGDLRAVDVSPFALERIRSNAKAGGASPKTIEHILGLVRGIFRKAKAWGAYKGAIPTDEIRLPKFDNKRTRFLTHAEADRLLLELNAVSETLYIQALLSLHAGLRFGEIVSLTWGAVDFDAGLITIFDPKGVDTRRAYMTAKMREALQAIRPRRARHEDPVFTSRSRQKRRRISGTFYRVAERLFNAGITDRRQKVTFHSLRHTFCSWLAASGATPFEIMELAGHKDLSMTRRYSHVAENAQRKAVERMTDEFENSRTGKAVVEEALKTRQ